MISTTVHLSPAGRLSPARFVPGDGRALAWLEIDAGSGGRVSLFGAPAEMRALAAAAVTAAEQTEQFGGVADQLRAAAEANGTG
jgi:hypothetical protein